MQKYINNVQDTFGNAVGSVTVTIRDNPGGGLSTIFSDNAGSAKSNPFTNDSDGEFFFYAVDGRYDIELTGPITETKADVRLLDVLTTGTTLRINTDISTASPPTTEAVTGAFQIWDLANDTQLANFGYVGDHDLRFRNSMRGGAFELTGTTSAGSEVFLIVGDPDAETTLYSGGQPRVRTATHGLINIGDVTTSIGGSQNSWLQFQDSSFNPIGQFGFTSGINFKISSLNHGAPFLITAEDTGGVDRNLITGDPDGLTTLYHAGPHAFSTLVGGASVYSVGNTDAETRVLEFRHSDGTPRGAIGHTGSDVFVLENRIHGGNMQFEGEAASGGAQRIFMAADPDGVTTFRAQTNLQFQVAGSESAIIATANADVALYYDAVEKFRTSDEAAADMISAAEVLNAAGAFKPVGLGVIEDDATAFGSGAQTPFQQINAHETIENNETVATSYTTYASTGSDQTNIPNGAQWEVKNTNTGALTILGGTSVTLTWFDGAGAVAPTGTRTLARAGRCVVRKINDTNYEIWGIGLT